LGEINVNGALGGNGNNIESGKGGDGGDVWPPELGIGFWHPSIGPFTGDGGGGSGGGILLYAPKIVLAETSTLTSAGGRHEKEHNGGVIKILTRATDDLTSASPQIIANQVHHGTFSLPRVPAGFVFDGDSGGWTNFQAGPTEESVGLELAPSDFGLQVATLEHESFGGWQSPLINTETAPMLHEAGFLVSTPGADPESLPELRLRATTSDLQLSASVLAVSGNDGAFSPTAEGRTYRLLIPSPGGRDLRLAFDQLLFDPAEREGVPFVLERAALRRTFIDLKSREHVRRYDFADGSQGWTAGHGTDNPPAFAAAGGALTMTGNGNAETFGFWTSPRDITIDPTRLYAVTFEVESSLPAEQRHQTPTFRCRLNESAFHQTSLLHVSSEGSADLLPAAGDARTYTVWLIPSGTSQNARLLISFDYLDYNEADRHDVTFYLRSVKVESVDLLK
jgi:hypothetical protein